MLHTPLEHTLTISSSCFDAKPKGVDAELKQYLIEMEERIVSSLKGYVNERSEQVETKLLTEFHKWASPAWNPSTIG